MMNTAKSSQENKRVISALGQTDNLSNREKFQKEDFAAITDATTIILKRLNFPLSKRRNIVCALQGAANGRVEFPLSHLALAHRLDHRGEKHSAEQFARRELKALKSFQQSSGYILFDIEQGGGTERRRTTYFDFITPAALLLVNRARQLKRADARYAKTPPGQIYEILVETAISVLPPFEKSRLRKSMECCPKKSLRKKSLNGKRLPAPILLQKTLNGVKQSFELLDSLSKPEEVRRFAELLAAGIIEYADWLNGSRNAATGGLSVGRAELSGMVSPSPGSATSGERREGLQNSSPSAIIERGEMLESDRALATEPDSSDSLAAVLRYAARGWAVLPLHSPDASGNGCSCAKGEKCESIGKHPRTKNGVKEATVDERQIRKWWRQFPNANIGIATGAASGIICLDIDPRNGGDASITEIIEQYGTLPATFEARTGAGTHLFFEFPENAAILRGKLADGIDVKGTGGYVVAAPSRHRNGNRYRITCAEPPAPLPEWLLGLLIKPNLDKLPIPSGDVVANLNSHPESIEKNRADGNAHGLLREGTRNNVLFRIACAMRGRGEAPDAVAAEISRVNGYRCSPPLSEDEVLRIVHNALKYEANITPKS